MTVTVKPPQLLLDKWPEAQPVEVEESEYEAVSRRILDQHPEFSPERHAEHLAYALCGHARAGKPMAPGSISDPTQAVNAMLADSAHAKDVARNLASAQMNALDENAKVIALALSAAADRISEASDRGMNAASERSGQASADAAEALKAFNYWNESNSGFAGKIHAEMREHWRVSGRDRWIQTGILAASILAVAGALLKGVL